MIVIDVNPTAFYIGPLSVRWYGIMYVVGTLVGLFVAWPYARSKGFTQEQLEKVAYWAVPAGVIGGRLYYVLQQPLGPYLSQPWRILDIREGGMAFYGAIFAVALVILIAGWRMKMSIWRLMDAAAIFAVVGQFFGRIGNLINGDIIGYPTKLPWGVVYANPNSFPARHDIAYQPAPVYEMILNLMLFSLLWWLRNKLKPGWLFFVYIFGYSITQLVVFFWRDNIVLLFGLKQAQLTAIGVMIIAAPLFYWLYRWQKGTARGIGDIWKLAMRTIERY